MSSQPVSLPAPGYSPSFHCAVENNLLDKSTIDHVNAQVEKARKEHLIGPGADQFMAGQGIKGLKGIGDRVGDLLASRAFSIYTIGDLAKYEGNFFNPIERLQQHDIDLLNTLRAGLNACKNPQQPTAIGHKVTVTENDPAMTATLTKGREVVQHNAGEHGYAELTLKGDPTDNGFVASFLALNFGPYGARGRRGGIIEFAGFDVSVLASESTAKTAERLKAELEQHGLAASITPLKEDHHGLPQHPVQVRIWSPRVVD